jgi:hypothetical protein
MLLPSDVAGVQKSFQIVSLVTISPRLQGQQRFRIFVTHGLPAAVLAKVVYNQHIKTLITHFQATLLSPP